jgi:alpha-tubulin suppressor-like RCC1 family protein
LGKRHGIALDAKHNVYGWGDGTYGELGNYIKDFPLKKPSSLHLFDME